MFGGVDRCQPQVEVPSGGEMRVDWRVKVVHEGEAVVRMKALTDEESDAVEQRFPVYVHGMLKTESFTGALRPDDSVRQSHVRSAAERTQAGSNAARSPLLADAGRRDGRCPALPGRLSLRLHRANAQSLPADRHHAASADRHEARPQGDSGKAHQPQCAGNRRRCKSARSSGSGSIANPVFDQAEVRRMVKDGVSG